MSLTLVIGNKNYSTWSLRPWLFLSAFNIEFTELNESLMDHELNKRLSQYSPTAKVPVLINNTVAVWDSLAICEYVNDAFLNGQGWPSDLTERAKARAITCEMHAGFNEVRSKMPMNIRAKRRIDSDPALEKDIQRIDKIFSDATPNGWLFDKFSIADCFFAPVALRFLTYGVSLSETATAYQERLLAHPSVQQWVKAALQETEIVPIDEAGEPV